MPRTKSPLEPVARPDRALVSPAIQPRQFVISAEHASNRIPAAYKNLGLTRRQLESHIAWDPGTKLIARASARALGCPCHEGRNSRLLVDLNRSPHHPKLMAPRSFSIAVPGNVSLSAEEKNCRIRLYYAPFREAILRDIRRAIETCGRCIHLSIHSFTPRVGREVRNAEIGLLYDPRRPLERLLADQLFDRLAGDTFQVRRNYPYRGTSDGHTTHLRTIFPPACYAGLEIEVNQRLLQSENETHHIARRLVKALQPFGKA
jgi:predicted N-formylglutamate amidohydrolase